MRDKYASDENKELLLKKEMSKLKQQEIMYFKQEVELEKKHQKNYLMQKQILIDLQYQGK